MKVKVIILHISIALITFLTTQSSFAQSDSISPTTTSANVDLVSRYIWRGQEYGQAPSIQPGLSVNWKGFTLGSWGAYKFTGAGDQETDFYLSKELGPLTISIWDYWNFCDTSTMDFFNYKEKTTSHAIEAQLQLSGGEKIPFNFLAGYFFYGSDSSRSVYLELQYNHSFGQNDVLLFAGFQPKGEYYGQKATFVNLGITIVREMRITDYWSLPVNVSCIVNPSNKSVYLVAGITL